MKDGLLEALDRVSLVMGEQADILEQKVKDIEMGKISPVVDDSEPLVVRGANPGIIVENPPHRKFYIVRERPSMQIVSYGWTPEEAWSFAKRGIPFFERDEMDKYFDTVILVGRPEGW